MSPWTISTPGKARSQAAFCPGWTMARTSSPRALSISTRWLPRKPLAPVTSTFMRIFSCLISGSAQRHILAGLGHRRLFQAARVKPGGCQTESLAQSDRRLIAQFAPRFVDAMPVVRAKHHGAQACYQRFCAGQRAHHFGSQAAVVDGPVGKMARRALCPDVIRDGVKDLSLCERLI